MPDVETIKMFFNYGVPAGILVLLCFLFYRISASSGRFLAPIIKDVATKHIETMETFEVIGKGLLDAQQAQTELLKLHNGMLGEHTTKIDQIHRAVVK